MTINQAFEHLLKIRGVHQILQVTSTHVNSVRSNFKQNPASVSIEKKLIWLQKANYITLTEYTFKPPIKPPFQDEEANLPSVIRHR